MTVMAKIGLPRRVALSACATVMACLPALARDGGTTWERHRLRNHEARIALQAPPTGSVRNLTINRRPLAPSVATPEDDDIYVDGPVRYNSVRTFDPAPYADSGRQFPFGLDGIGGFGSDLGFGTGYDSASYNRGP